MVKAIASIAASRDQVMALWSCDEWVSASLSQSKNSKKKSSKLGSFLMFHAHVSDISETRGLLASAE
jgi:hypothetical protein